MHQQRVFPSVGEQHVSQHSSAVMHNFQFEGESEFTSAIGHQLDTSNDAAQMAHLENVLGDRVRIGLWRFKDDEIEHAYIETRSEQRQMGDFGFVDSLETQLLGIYVTVWLVSAATNVSRAGSVSFVYVLLCTLVIMVRAAVKQIDRLMMRDTSLVTGIVTLTISIGYPTLLGQSESDTIRCNLNRSLGEFSMLTVAHLLCVALLSPVKTKGFVQLGVATIGLYLMASVLMMIQADAAFELSIVTQVLLASVVMCVSILYTCRRDQLLRKTWFLSKQNGELRHNLLRNAAGETLHKAGHRRGSNSSGANSEAEPFFRILKESAGISRLRISMADIEVFDFVGRGAMGEVFEAMYMDAPVALKRLPVALLNKESAEQYVAEVKLHKELRHPNVVQLMGVVWSEESEMVGMVLELMTRGSLRSVLQDRSLQLSWEDPKCKLAIDIAKGMAFLHGLHILHRDLKTENILVSSTFTSKVSDFGTSRLVKKMTTTPVGTPFWRAPEMIRAEQYDSKADVYSFAMVLLEIATGENPFAEMTPLDALDFPHKVAHDNFRLPIPDRVPEEIRRVITRCWDPNPAMRPPFLLVRRELTKFLTKVTSDDDLREDNQLTKVMIDQIIMSGEYKRVTFKDGESIIRCGDQGEECYIIMKGTVDVFIPRQDKYTFNPTASEFKDQWVQVASVQEGDYFGEMGMYASTERTAECVANGEVSCITFDRDTFANKLDEDIHAMVAAKIFRSLHDKKGRALVTNKQRELQSRILHRVDTIKTRKSFHIVDEADIERIAAMANSAIRVDSSRHVDGSKSLSHFRPVEVVIPAGADHSRRGSQRSDTTTSSQSQAVLSTFQPKDI